MSSVEPRGAVLVSALVLVASAAGLAAFIAWRGLVSVHQAENLRDQSQARWLAQAAVSYAKWVLEVDAGGRDGSSTLMDHLSEPWAQPLPRSRITNLFKGQLTERDILWLDSAYFMGSVEDLQARFNLAPVMASATVKPFQHIGLGLLFGFAGVPSPQETSDRFIAILSEAQEPTPGQKAGLSSLQRHLAVQKALHQMDLGPGATARLTGWLVWLSGPTAVNVNTAPAEVLAAALNLESVETLAPVIASRERIPFRSLSEVSALIPVSGGLSLSKIDVRSSYFRAFGIAEFGRAELGFEAWMERRGQFVSVIFYREGSVL